MAQRLSLAVLAVGVALRLHAVAGPAGGDSGNYVALARRMSWRDPWASSSREPVWEMFVKVTTAPFGYRVGALQVVTCVVSVVALLMAAWVLRQLAHPWVAVAGTTALALSRPLVDTAASGMRESTSALVVVVAVALALRAPGWVPVLAAVTLGVRWELGIALVVVSVLYGLGQVVTPRHLVGGALAAAVLVGPFLVDNAGAEGDPLFHSNLHATFYANIETTGGTTPTGTLPLSERIRPDITPPLYRAPLRSWTGYVEQVGYEEMVDREVRAAVTLPVDAARGGWLPWAAGVVVFAAAVAGALVARDRVTVLLVVVSLATVAGYGLVLPWFDRRLISHLGVALVLLACPRCPTPPSDVPRKCASSGSQDPERRR